MLKALLPERETILPLISNVVEEDYQIIRKSHSPFVEHILGRRKESSQRSQTNCASALAQHEKSKIRDSG